MPGRGLFRRSSQPRRRDRLGDFRTAVDRAFAADPSGIPPEDLLGPLNAEERRHAPEKLFVAGDRSLLVRHPKVSIVGSRQPSDESLRRAARLAKVLVEHDVVVVSGLAKGIDAAAHRSAIAAGGKTIAVIGTPLDKTYPRENAELQHQIAREHLVTSQFPKGYPTMPACFPMRNRTMALIVDASVIVEAGETSGSLSQGWEALRLARLLFIMRSVAERPDLRWPREMMRYGALVLNEPEELLEALPYGDPSALLSA
jgi:DNA processing protein